MKNWKKYTALLLALVICLAFTACGGNDDPDNPSVVGNDWRVTGIVRGSGTITRGGEDTDVLVCVYAENAAFYYDTEDQVLFDSVGYPTALKDKVALSGDVWGMFKSIDFADLNGDGNSDVTMKFTDDGGEFPVVWIWDGENERFVYQPEGSEEPDDPDEPDGPNTSEGGNGNAAKGFDVYEGLWLATADNQYEGMYIQFDAEGNWTLTSGGSTIDEGYLWYAEEEDVTFVRSYQGGALTGGYIEADGDEIYITTAGYFTYLDGRGGQWQGDGGGQGSASRFAGYEGLWLATADNQYEGMYIQFDAEGNWTLTSGGETIDEGYLWYDEEDDAIYVYSYQGGALTGGYTEVDGDEFFMSTAGYFTYLDGRDGQWQGDAGGNWDGN